MISTVTTSTVSTVTTAALAGSVILIGIILLFGLLVQKEIAVTSTNASAKRMSKILNIAIIPLLIAFIVIVITKVMEYF